jgi:hypothetical protein
MNTRVTRTLGIVVREMVEGCLDAMERMNALLGENSTDVRRASRSQ